MGRYYDEKISLDGLDPANPLFGPVIQAAEEVDRKESEFYRLRRDLFTEMNFGSFNRDEVQVEFNYVAAVPNVSVWNFRNTFNSVNPSSYSGSGLTRLVRDSFDKVDFSSPLADVYDVEEDDDGDDVFTQATDVHLYPVGRGEPNVDTLFTNLRVFTSNNFISKSPPYFEFVDDDTVDDPGYYPLFDVYEGFGEVPYHWQPKSGFTSQQLQIMYAAGNAFNSIVGPAINDFESKYNQYLSSGGGNLDEDFYTGGTPNAPWQNFQGSSVSYNRPQNLPASLIKEARGL